MWSRPDRRLAQRDEALPALRVLLDDAAMAEWLEARVPGLRVAEARCTYVRYKPGIRVLSGWVVRTREGDDHLLHAWSVRGDDLHKLEKQAQRTGVHEAGPGGYILAPEDRILVEFYPNDRRLRNLAQMADPELRSELLVRKLGLPDEGRTRPALESSFRVLAYKPERRFVGVGELGGPGGAAGTTRVAVRGYTGERFRRPHRAARAFHSGGVFRIPRLLASSRRRQLLFMEWMPGEPLGARRLDALEGAGRSGLGFDLGAGLAELHAQCARRIRQRGRSSEAWGLRGAARGVQGVIPGRWGRRARRLARSLEAHLRYAGTPQEPPVPLHGDFHPEQVLQGPGGGLVLLDFDRARMGDPEADLASFIAHLERRELGGELSGGATLAFEDALLDGYRSAGGQVTDARYRIHRAAALLRLAPHPFRDRCPDWDDLTHTLLERALELSPGP